MEKRFLISDGCRQVPCILSEPAHGRIRRVVLGVHGFAGSTQDEIQVGIAEEMALFDSAVLRFDFPAHGDSPVEELTLEGCLGSLLAAARWAKEAYPQVDHLCVFASGFGAYVTLLALQELLELPGQVRLVVQTPSVLMHSTLLSMINMSRETFWAMERVKIPTPRSLEVTYGFYEELRENMAMASYPIPMLILHGEEDAYIRGKDIQSLRRINEDARLVVIPGASHRFLEEGAWDMVLDLTRDWFEFEQVLVCDWE